MILNMYPQFQPEQLSQKYYQTAKFDDIFETISSNRQLFGLELRIHIQDEYY